MRAELGFCTPWGLPEAVIAQGRGREAEKMKRLLWITQIRFIGKDEVGAKIINRRTSLGGEEMSDQPAMIFRLSDR